MTKLTMTAIAAIGLATPAFAESHVNSDDDMAKMTETDSAAMNRSSALESGTDPRAENLVRTRDITGGNIYSVAASDDEWLDMEFDVVDSAWNDIGEIEDVLLNEDGQMQGIVAEIGGFFDIADKHVFLATDDVKLVPVDDQTYAYVTRYSEEELESMNGVDEAWWN